MVAKSYLLCKTNKFNREGYFIPIQQDLFEHEGTSVAKLEINKPDFHLGFDQYECYYDYKHKTKGIVFNKPFNYYFEPLNFYAYYRDDLKLSLFQTKTDAAIEFTNKLNSTKHFDINPFNIQFNKIIPLIVDVAGAWIADLKRAHLRTAGFFGPNVHKSEEYKQAAEEGNVSSIQMKYISEKNNSEYYVAISRKGSIILYDTLPTIEDEIDLVYEVYSKLICPHLNC
ncbi:hypothetical protein [Caldifermentibacillus hisashii]|uniref:hypothetical protein n=1 Tax=Caldifermentibacillus hisashii TaxID=996558 RepID=UPI0031014B46